MLTLAAWCIALSAVAALTFLVGNHTPSVRGASGGVGIMAALIRLSVACWFSLRARDARLRVAALASLPPSGFGAGRSTRLSMVSAPNKTVQATAG